MAVDINSVVISGNLTRDSEFKAVGNGGFITFSVATNESKRKEDGTYENYPNYFDCSYYSKGAEKLTQFMKKGSPVCVQGALHQDRWEKDGVKNSRVLIRVTELKMLPKGNAQTSGGASAGAASQGEFPNDVPW